MVDQPQFGMDIFWQQASQVVERMVTSQRETIGRAARLFASCIERDGVIHTYGTGHSRAFAMELAYRAGGLVPFNRIDLEDLALYRGWNLARVKSADIERDLEAGQQILSCYQIEPHDSCIITSQSGVNAAIVECALQVKERGLPLVTVTAMEHTTHMEPRHPSGKKLYELADIVIDNCGPFGDALLDLPSGGRACSVSSITGALIAQMLTAEIIGLLLEDGQEPPVLISSNVPGGIERNEQLHKHYEGRVRW